MRISVFLVLFGVGYLLTAFLQDANYLVEKKVSAQIPGCASFMTQEQSCHVPNECDLGVRRFSEHSSQNGIQDIEIQEVMCDGMGEGCETAPLAVAEDKPDRCCDQDQDGFNRSACGGDDCNDNPANNGENMNPGISEIAQWIAGGELDCSLCDDGIDNDCDGTVDLQDSGCALCNFSPIIIDLSGNGFNLTDAASGVNFDLNDTSNRERLSWTAMGSDDSFLVYDRNGNGTIDNGRELFGNMTAQSQSANPHGFIALAEFDKPANGGNSDGKINHLDTVFPALRLWRDANHNGVSEASELQALRAVNVYAISLDYRESRRVDQYGNRFRYRAKVADAKGAHIGRWAWDVFLVAR